MAENALVTNRYDLSEIAGAFGDLGPLVPFVAAYIGVLKMDPLGVLLAFGVSMIVCGLLYRTPLPVQPMKAAGAIATTQAAQRPEPTLGELTAAIKGADLILVEGFKSEKHPKLEVRRLDALNRTPLAPGDPSIVAIAADFGAEGGHLPVFGLDEVEAIADFILNHHQLRPKNKRRS